MNSLQADRLFSQMQKKRALRERYLNAPQEDETEAIRTGWFMTKDAFKGRREGILAIAERLQSLSEQPQVLENEAMCRLVFQKEAGLLSEIAEKEETMRSHMPKAFEQSSHAQASDDFILLLRGAEKMLKKEEINDIRKHLSEIIYLLLSATKSV